MMRWVVVVAIVVALGCGDDPEGSPGNENGPPVELADHCYPEEGEQITDHTGVAGRAMQRNRGDMRGKPRCIRDDGYGGDDRYCGDVYEQDTYHHACMEPCDDADFEFQPETCDDFIHDEGCFWTVFATEEDGECAYEEVCVPQDDWPLLHRPYYEGVPESWEGVREHYCDGA